MFNKILTLHMPARLTCVWVSTGDPHNPLVCVWAENTPPRKTAKAPSPSNANSGRMPRCA
jgi:hypothetical protein